MFNGALKNFFNINLRDYENIGINLEINKVLLGVFIALAVGMLFLNLYRGNIRLAVKQLMRHEATSEESAKTLGELGLKESRILRYMLSRDNLLTKVIGRTGEPTYSYDEYVTLSKEKKLQKVSIDFETATFYIREEKMDRAKHICDRYETGKMKTAMSCILILLVYVCIAAAMPELLNIVNNLLKNSKM